MYNSKVEIGPQIPASMLNFLVESTFLIGKMHSYSIGKKCVCKVRKLFRVAFVVDTMYENRRKSAKWKSFIDFRIRGGVAIRSEGI